MIMNERLPDQSSKESIEEKKEQVLAYIDERLTEAERYLDHWEVQNTQRLLSNSEEAGKRLVFLEDVVSNLKKDIKLIERGNVKAIEKYWTELQDSLANVE